MIVALDAMGGDLAPMEIVKGAAEAAKELDVLIKLVGREEDVTRELAKYDYPKERIEVVHAEEVIGTDEVPTAIFETMTDDLDLVARILSQMSTSDRGKILGAMNSEIAAKITRMMDPES